MCGFQEENLGAFSIRGMNYRNRGPLWILWEVTSPLNFCFLEYMSRMGLIKIS